MAAAATLHVSVHSWTSWCWALAKAWPVMVLSLFVFLHRPNSRRPLYCLLVGTGLAFGALGDVLLFFHDGLRADGMGWDVRGNWILTGMIMFVLGHLCYVLGLLFLAEPNQKENYQVLMFVPLGCVFVAIYTHLLDHIKPTSLHIPVLLYGFVLTMLLLTAVSRFLTPSRLSPPRYPPRLFYFFWAV
jgi:uncharacterized membrane protein YhhN